MTMDNAQVHRFGDKVAVSLPGDGETVYLSPENAHEIANALKLCAFDIANQRRASQSTFPTARIVLDH